MHIINAYGLAIGEAEAELVNVAGPLASGIAVALLAVQQAHIAEHDGERPALDPVDRGHLIGLCAVSAQLLGDATMDACNALISLQATPNSSMTGV